MTYIIDSAPSAPVEDSIQRILSLNGPLYAINERSEEGIPAVELDGSTGKYLVLIFTSEQNAKKYCWLRKPNIVEFLYELPRRTDPHTKEVVQAGLIRIARKCHHNHKEISHFVFDHPGTKSPASYAAVEDIALLGRKVVPRDLVLNPINLRSFIEAADED